MALTTLVTNAKSYPHRSPTLDGNETWEGAVEDILDGIIIGQSNLLSGAPRPATDTAGKIYYVHPDFGSDSNDGLSTDKPFKTILKARTVSAARIDWAASGTPWANQDTIILFPGVYDETALTGGLYGVNVIGLGSSLDVDGEMGVKICPATGSAWDAASWINGGMYNVCFAAPADDGTEALLTLDTLNNFIIADCLFKGVAGGADTLIGFQTNTEMAHSRFLRNQFYQCLTGINLGVNAKQITDALFQDLVIFASTTAGISVDADAGANAVGAVFDRFIITDSPALGIDDNATAAAYTIMYSNGDIYAVACDPATASGGKYSRVYLNGTLLTTS